MQKKLIALAVAGLVSGAAFAQTNVTLFGIMDMGYQYKWSNVNSDVKNKSSIDGGGQDGSRFGLRGSEDLGNGLKVNFEMVAGYDADTGYSYGGNGRLMSEGAWVGLEGASWGQVKAGYIASFLDDNTGIDVTGRIGVGSTGALYGTGKYANFVAWYSPKWDGFQVKAGFSSNIYANDQDTAPAARGVGFSQQDLNVRAYTVAASYDNGPWKAGVAYASYQPQDVDVYLGGNKWSSTDSDKGDEWNAGVSYDFGMAAVSLLGAVQNNPSVSPGDAFDVWVPNIGIPGSHVSTTQYTSADTGLTDGASGYLDNRKFWALGVKIPLTPKDSLRFGYAQAKSTYVSALGTQINPNSGFSYRAGGDTETSKVFTVTYLHELSKRTNIYALYGNVRSDDDIHAIGGSTIDEDGNRNGYKQAISVGLRHLF